MPDFNQTRTILGSYLSARVPLIVIRTIETDRAMDVVRSAAADLRSLGYYEHSRTEGLKDLLNGQVVEDDTSLAGALENARVTFKARSNVNFVFTDVEDIDQETSTSRHLAEMVRLAERNSGSIILVVAKPVWSGLGRLGMSVSLDLPTTEEMAQRLAEIIDEHAQIVRIEWQHSDVRRAAEILTGMTELEAVNVLMTLLTKRQLLVSDIPVLSEYKDNIFGELSGLERIHLRENYRVGGLRQLQQWLKRSEFRMKEELGSSPVPPPKGVLLVGIPGCGKSLSAKAIAHNWHLPLYRLDMAGILGMYVGQSESQLREALEAAERVAPCVLWIDEIEKALATGLGDSGTSKRLVGQFLFWLQESIAKVFIVATANDVASLPPELLRKGRFDEMFFVDLPDRNDREEILRMYFQKYTDTDISPVLGAELVDLTEGFSGSDIDATVRDIAVSMRIKGTAMLPPDAEVRDWFADVVPYSRSNPEDVSAIRAWAQGRCLVAGSPSADFDPGIGGIRRRLIV